MDEKRHNELRDYLRFMANEMGLRDWTVTLSSDRPDNGNHAADVVCLYGRKYLTVRLTQGFENYSLEEQRHWITHELVHAHLWALDFTLNNIRDHLPSAAFDVLKGCFDDGIEFAVDAIAEIVAPHMALPVKKTRKAKPAPAPKPDEAQEAA